MIFDWPNHAIGVSYYDPLHVKERLRSFYVSPAKGTRFTWPNRTSLSFQIENSFKTVTGGTSSLGEIRGTPHGTKGVAVIFVYIFTHWNVLLGPRRFEQWAWVFYT